MELEKNPITRSMFRRLLKLHDKMSGHPFPGMKRVRQITTSHCGPAVIVELFSFLGFTTSQAAVVRCLRAGKKIRRKGLNISDLARAVRFLGKGKYSFWKKAGAGISDLSKVIEKYKYPVGVEWQGVFYEYEDEDNGHYAVVTKVDKKAGFLRIADSYGEFAGVDRRFEVGFFKSRWWDTNEVKGRVITDKKMMFVVAPKGDSWPKKLGMIRY